jgi:hypothetical protein
LTHSRVVIDHQDPHVIQYAGTRGRRHCLLTGTALLACLQGGG